MSNLPPVTQPLSAVSIHSPFSPRWWSRNSHFQTLYGALLSPRMTVDWKSERWDTPDQDYLDVFRLSASDDAPVLILLHGLEGNANSRYIRQTAALAHHQGWAVVAPHFRGCGPHFNQAARLYHAGDSTELQWILERLRQEFPTVPRYAAGFSLGGNLLIKWLGEQGENAQHWVTRCAAIATPFDLVLVGDHLARGFNRLYTRNFLTTLKAKARAKAQQYPGLFDLSRTLSATTLRQFDDHCMAPLHGFLNAQDYWTKSSCRPWLNRLHCPTLLLQSTDDPFIPPNALPLPAELSPDITWDLQRHGGHVGFVADSHDTLWMARRILTFLDPGTSLGDHIIAE